MARCSGSGIRSAAPGPAARSAAPPRKDAVNDKASPPAPVQRSGGGSLLGGIGSTISQERCPEESLDNDFFMAGGARKFSYNAVAVATNNWSKERKLGEGGFGAVYEGFLKESDCKIAVKKLSTNSKQGIKEYASEVKIISQSRHRNIVKLIGWCHEKDELLLVYEFMPKGSLDSHLFKKNCSLPWEVRYEIVLGVASGLHYLHEGLDPYVVHRDIKPSNIMLDSDFKPKIGDFGLARRADRGKGLPQSTAVAGTFGYMAPEYFNSGTATKKADVYSFGIVALEIACGRKINDRKAKEDQKDLRKWVWGLYGEGKVLEAVDPRLNGDFDKKQAECLMIVGLWCAHPDEKSRTIMEKAIRLLKSPFSVPDSDHSFSKSDWDSFSKSDIGSAITLFSTTITDLSERKFQGPCSSKSTLKKVTKSNSTGRKKIPTAPIVAEMKELAGDQKFVCVNYKMYFYCEGCVEDVEYFTKRLKGVEGVKADSESNKLMVAGKVDPLWIKSQLEMQFKKKKIEIWDESKARIKK